VQVGIRIAWILMRLGIVIIGKVKSLPVQKEYLVSVLIRGDKNNILEFKGLRIQPK
jgi:hypothetical protein